MEFKVTGKFKSANEIAEIAYYICRPIGEVRAVVQISHGMCEYFRRYDGIAAFLNSNGIAVVGNDHLGHGASVNSDDELGWMAKSDGWRYAVEDLHTVTKIAKDEFGEVPYILFGHSMGSFFARAYLSKYSTEIDGAIICGTGGKNPLIGAGIALASFQCKIFGQKHRSTLLGVMAFGSYCSRYENPKTTSDWISRDEKEVELYCADPYCTFTFTASAYKDLFLSNRFVNMDEWYNSIIADIPILVISGEMDPVGDYGKGVREVFDGLIKAGKNATLKLYPNARHEILREINRDEVFSDILNWLDKLIAVLES